MIAVRNDVTPSTASEPPSYPTGTSHALLQTALVTPQTRRVLEERLDAPSNAPTFFDETTFATLRAVCNRLIPQPDREQPIDIASAVDDRLAHNAGKGWRYANMPPDREAYPLALRGIDETARAMFGAPFVDLPGDQQDAVLQAIQDGSPVGETWQRVPSRLFFEELLAELVESYYSHPLGYDEIGYVGYADANGWHERGLDRLEAHEPRPLP